MSDSDQELNTQQRAFVEEFLIDLNATKAAERAGYSKKAARQQGSRLLSHAYILEAIAEAKAERSKRVKATADWVLQRLVDQAEADIADLYDDNTGKLKPVNEWPEVWRKGMISGIETQELFEYGPDGKSPIGTVVKIRSVNDNRKTMETIGKHVDIKAWDKPEAPGNDDNPLSVLLTVVDGEDGLPDGD